MQGCHLEEQLVSVFLSDFKEAEKLKGIVDNLHAVLSKRCDQEGKQIY